MSGYVYLVTSPVLNAVKIGCWSSSLCELRSRYATAYGPGVAVQARFVRDCFKTERDLHRMFKDQCLGGELFSKDYVKEYTEALVAVSTLHADFPETLEVYSKSSVENAFLGIPQTVPKPTEKAFRRSCCRRAPIEVLPRTARDVRQVPGSYTGMY